MPLGPARSYREELALQRGRLGLVAEKSSAVAETEAGCRRSCGAWWRRSAVVKLRSCNGGRDNKLPLDPPAILSDVIEPSEW